MYKKTISEIVNNSTSAQKPIFELSKEQVSSLKSASEVVLAIIGVVGLVSVALVAPNLLAGIGKISRFNKGKKLSFEEKREKVRRTFYYLKERGLVDWKDKNGDLEMVLTEKGGRRLQKIMQSLTTVPKAKKWDGRWWQVAADVPTTDYRSSADKLRRQFKRMNFYPLQRTLWFYPYDPRKQVAYIAQKLDIYQFVTVMEISKTDPEDGEKLLKYFKSLNIL